jgi:hypothetical protein
VIARLKCVAKVRINIVLVALNAIWAFLGAFAKLRKATVSFVMSVRMEKLGFHWTDFDET